MVFAWGKEQNEYNMNFSVLMPKTETFRQNIYRYVDD